MKKLILTLIAVIIAIYVMGCSTASRKEANKTTDTFNEYRSLFIILKIDQSSSKPLIASTCSSSILPLLSIYISMVTVPPAAFTFLI